VRLEVFDRGTHEAIERLISAGLLAPTLRAARPFAPGSSDQAPIPLSDAERSRIATLRDQTARRLKVGRVLGEAGLVEEARPPLIDAIHLRARALAVMNRLPEPENIEAAFLPPVALHFAGDLPAFRGFVTEETGDWQTVAAALLASAG
jgi:hypothetical protein